MTRPGPPTSARRCRRRKQAGFTLVELVAVIVILGVLAAVALPRFANLQGNAREAKVRSVHGSIRAAAALVKATALAQGVSCSSPFGTVSLEARNIDLNYCYPQALSDLETGIFGAANVLSSDNWVINDTADGDGSPGADMQINLSGAATPASCSVSYTSAAGADAAPIIKATTSGC